MFTCKLDKANHYECLDINSCCMFKSFKENINLDIIKIYSV